MTPDNKIAELASQRYLMVKGLHHQWGMKDDHEFFALIDATGGWPPGYKFVGFEHTDERAAGFCNSSINTGMWTVLASADDYYMWKLSPEALQRIVDAAIESVRLPRVLAQNVYIRNWRNYRAAVTPPPTKKDAPNE